MLFNKTVSASVLIITCAAALMGDYGNIKSSFSEPPDQHFFVPESKDFKIWIPEGVDTVRGVIAVCWFAAGLNCFWDSHHPKDSYKGGEPMGWRKFCIRNNFAQMSYGRTGDDRGLTGADVHKYLGRLAEISGHTELNYVGVIPTGLSAGGGSATLVAMADPSRTIGFFPIAGYRSSITTNEEMFPIPGLGVTQGNDQFYPCCNVNTIPMVDKGRENDALWAPNIALGVAHTSISKMEFVILWCEEIAKLRVPQSIPLDAPHQLLDIPVESGWLGLLDAHSTSSDGASFVVDKCEIYPYNDAPGDKRKLYWLPSKRAAETWKYYHLNNSILPDDMVTVKHRYSVLPVISESNQLRWSVFSPSGRAMISLTGPQNQSLPERYFPSGVYLLSGSGGKVRLITGKTFGKQ